MVLSDLPSDVVDHILLKLPIKSLGQCSSVNKSMFKQTADPHFIEKHLNDRSAKRKRYFILRHQSIVGTRYYTLNCPETFVELMKLEVPIGQSPTNFEVLGSCNGLLLISCPQTVEPGCSLHIWNPIIRYVKDIPDTLAPCPNLDSHVAYGFGYIPQLNDFRVLKIVYREKFVEGQFPEFPPIVDLYSLKADAWKRIETSLPYLMVRRISMETQRGLVYFITSKKISETLCLDLIVSFNLLDEVFQEILTPECCFNSHGHLEAVTSIYTEFLCLFVRQSAGWNVWAMIENGSDYYWLMLIFMENQEYGCWPQCFADNGEVVCDSLQQGVTIYNPRDKWFLELLIDGGDMFEVIPFVESLALLDKKNGPLIEHYEEDMEGVNNIENQS